MKTINTRMILATSLISDEDYKALDLVVNNSLHLASKDINLGDLISKVHVELSAERKCRTHRMDASAISASLVKLKKQYDVVYKEYSKVRDESLRLILLNQRDEDLCDRCNRLEIKVGTMSSNIKEAEDLLEGAVGGKVEVPEKIMGEFISTPHPKVVLYYQNIQDAYRGKVSGLVPVFVHEMFHAWNYFEAGCHDRSVMEIDEAMVEFATIHFLNSLVESLAKVDSKQACLISERANLQKRSVRDKKKSVGSIAAYGFGSCLDDRISTEAPLWIETYAVKSASLNPSDSNVAKVMTSLAPFYPFENEGQVFMQLKDILFANGKTRATSSSNPSQIDILKSCLDTISQDEFTLDDVYAYEPIFKVLYPNNMHLRDKIRQLLQVLVDQGDIIRVTPGCYKKI